MQKIAAYKHEAFRWNAADTILFSSHELSRWDRGISDILSEDYQPNNLLYSPKLLLLVLTPRDKP